MALQVALKHPSCVPVCGLAIEEFAVFTSMVTFWDVKV